MINSPLRYPFRITHWIDLQGNHLIYLSSYLQTGFSLFLSTNPKVKQPTRSALSKVFKGGGFNPEDVPFGWKVFSLDSEFHVNAILEKLEKDFPSCKTKLGSSRASS